MATKSVFTFVILAILLLVIFEVPETEAQGRKCLKEYGGDVGFSFCAPRIYPSLCYSRCRANKGAKGGICVWAENSVKCLCDYCNDKPSPDLKDHYAF